MNAEIDEFVSKDGDIESAITFRSEDLTDAVVCDANAAVEDENAVASDVEVDDDDGDDNKVVDCNDAEGNKSDEDEENNNDEEYEEFEGETSTEEADLVIDEDNGALEFITTFDNTGVSTMEVTSDVALNCVFVETAFECRGLSSMMMS